MIDKFFNEFIYFLSGPKKKKIKLSKKPIFVYLQYKMVRTIFKKHGLFIGLFVIYVLTFNRIIRRLFPTRTIEPTDEEKAKFAMNRVTLIEKSCCNNKFCN